MVQQQYHLSDTCNACQYEESLLATSMITRRTEACDDTYIHLRTAGLVIDKPHRNYPDIARCVHLLRIAHIATLQYKSGIMAFSFGFSGDDIEEDLNDVQDQEQQQPTTTSDAPSPIPARTHDLDELVGLHVSSFPFPLIRPLLSDEVSVFRISYFVLTKYHFHVSH
jgi:hypothetical protein